MAALNGFARGMFMLASGTARISRWAEEKSRRLEVTMSKDEVAVLKR